MNRAAARETIFKTVEAEMDEKTISILFVDPRENGGLQLTALGYNLLKDKFPHWTEALPEKMTVANHTYLVAVSTLPYHIHDNLLTTFDTNLGMLLKMTGGDFERLRTLLPPF